MNAGDRIRLKNDIEACGILAGKYGVCEEVKPDEVRVTLDRSTEAWAGRVFWVDRGYVLRVNGEE